ncbi:MAG: CDP-diacylglycerol--glycerol-3-phosphate 3-phosphatidyltransferase [FCB group bacterium]|jgi:CDP-diacylglycerol--glycerol-3-phosphate 3-phosphatidyltransferase
MKFTLPNILSILRTVIAPVFYILMVSKNVHYCQIACILFILGAITDYFDGWLARTYNQTSSWGKFFDPLADKILTSAAFLAFVSLGIIQLWMVLIIIIRDFGTTWMRIYADSKNEPIVTSLSAKWKTFLQMLFIVYLLILLFIKNSVSSGNPIYNVDLLLYSSYTYIMMLVLTLLTLWTAIEYVNQNKSIFGLLRSKI